MVEKGLEKCLIVDGGLNLEDCRGVLLNARGTQPKEAWQNNLGRTEFVVGDFSFEIVDRVKSEFLESWKFAGIHLVRDGFDSVRNASKKAGKIKG